MRNLDRLTSLKATDVAADPGANWWFYFYGNPPALPMGHEVVTP